MVIERGELSWEQAIAHTTLLPAQTMGFGRKGRIRAGMDADLLVFDPETICDRADFPGLGRPDAAPEGIRFVIVSGEIAAENGIDWNGSALDAAVVPAVLRLPEVIQNDQQTVSEAETQALKRCVEEAVDHMEQFRIQEGTILIADLLRRIDRIEQLKEEIVPFEKARAETIKTRIRENIESLGIPFDANRLEQEMIYYIEKLDITEEKVRLQNHCKYFREVARGEEAPGRKLGFIAQELGREINTLGSKANEATIQKKVVEMKDELEKIKEQVLNIL